MNRAVYRTLGLASRWLITIAVAVPVTFAAPRLLQHESSTAAVVDAQTGTVVLQLDGAAPAGSFAVALATDNDGFVVVGTQAALAASTGVPQQNVERTLVAALDAPQCGIGVLHVQQPSDEPNVKKIAAYPGWTRGRGS